MSISKWLSRADHPDRHRARQFTPKADGLEDRISLSGFDIAVGSVQVSVSANDSLFNSANSGIGVNHLSIS